jgi:hypothetical protein
MQFKTENQQRRVQGNIQKMKIKNMEIATESNSQWNSMDQNLSQINNPRYDHQYESDINQKSEVDCGSFIICSNKQQASGHNGTLSNILKDCYNAASPWDKL